MGGDQFARLAQELNQTQLRLLFQFNTGFQALRALAQRLEILGGGEVADLPLLLKQISTSLYTPLGEFCPSTKLGVVSLPGSSSACQVILSFPVERLKRQYD